MNIEKYRKLKEIKKKLLLHLMVKISLISKLIATNRTFKKYLDL